MNYVKRWKRKEVLEMLFELINLTYSKEKLIDLLKTNKSIIYLMNDNEIL